MIVRRRGCGGVCVFVQVCVLCVSVCACVFVSVCLCVVFVCVCVCL